MLQYEKIFDRNNSQLCFNKFDSFLDCVNRFDSLLLHQNWARKFVYDRIFFQQFEFLKKNYK